MVRTATTWSLDTTSHPSYAQVTLNGQANWTWAASTNDPRGLQQGADPSARIAACWYAPTSLTIDVNLTDGNPHTLAVYTVDWDSTTRAVSLTVRDASSGAVLDSRDRFELQRRALHGLADHGARDDPVTQTGQTNAVVSGLFFDSDTGNRPPSVTLTSPSNGVSYVAPATIPLSATANASAGVQRVKFYQGTTLIATSASTGQSVYGELGERGDRDLHTDGQGV